MRNLKLLSAASDSNKSTATITSESQKKQHIHKQI